MQALMLDPPAELLEERCRLGLDGRDEVWEGVLHMVPPASFEHQSISAELHIILNAIAKARGWFAVYETGLFDPEQGFENFRVPDLVVVDRAYTSERGIEGRAELVVEIVSPKDESRKKMPYYARHAVQEVWLIDRDTRATEIYTLRGGTYFAVAPERDGSVRSPLFGLDFEVITGPKLRVRSADTTTEI